MTEDKNYMFEKSKIFKLKCEIWFTSYDSSAVSFNKGEVVTVLSDAIVNDKEFWVSVYECFVIIRGSIYKMRYPVYEKDCVGETAFDYFD